jgi:hypothetical protein
LSSKFAKQGKNRKVEYTYGWYSASARNGSQKKASARNILYARIISRKIRHKVVRRNALNLTCDLLALTCYC